MSKSAKKPAAPATQPAPQGAGLSPEAAIALMRPKVRMELSSLAKQGIIAPHEKQDFEQILNMHICRMLPSYDPERTGHDGRKASPRRYLNYVVHNALSDIVRHKMARKRAIPTIPMPLLEDDVAGDDERQELDLEPYTDKRRPHDTLTLKMDLETIAERLTPAERITLRMRIEGYSFAEIARAVNARLNTAIDRFHVMNVLLRKVAKALSEAGYAPQKGWREMTR